MYNALSSISLIFPYPYQLIGIFIDYVAIGCMSQYTNYK